jgi:hypothetical protein
MVIAQPDPFQDKLSSQARLRKGRRIVSVPELLSWQGSLTLFQYVFGRHPRGLASHIPSYPPSRACYFFSLFISFPRNVILISRIEPVHS